MLIKLSELMRLEKQASHKTCYLLHPVQGLCDTFESIGFNERIWILGLKGCQSFPCWVHGFEDQEGYGLQVLHTLARIEEQGSKAGILEEINKASGHDLA